MELFNIKLIRWGIIPLVLVVLWAVLTIKYVDDNWGSNILTYNYHRSNFTTWKESELLKQEKVRAEFKASANNLGIVAVRFNTYVRINDDLLIFRLKEKGQRNWFYENTYRVDQFQPNGLFPFGFPVIQNSENKIYQFELESKKGQPEDAVALSIIEPNFITKHEYAKSTLIKDKKILLEFAYKKSENLISDSEFIKNSFVYVLPLVFYIIWQIFLSPTLKTSRSITAKTFKGKNSKSEMFRNLLGLSLSMRSLLSLSLLFIVYDTFFIKEVSQIVIIILIGIWIFVISNFKLTSRVTFVCAFFFLALCPILLIIKWESIAEKAAIWAYMFLLVGTIQQMLEIKSEKKYS